MSSQASNHAAVVRMTRVVRNYQGLRPLRIASLTVAPGERVALSGIDAVAAEVLINLVTGAALPDEGDVQVFGRSTAHISTGDDWLAFLEQFGIVSPRAVLIEGASIQQNLAMPFTLQIDPVPSDIAQRVQALAVECGIASDRDGIEERLSRPAGEAPPEMRARLHFARAIALDPGLVLLEHPTAGVEGPARHALGDDMARVLEGRRLAALVITQDEPFALRVADRTLKLQPATGELKPQRRGWFK
jgi:ABC-type transporter Mla maintaining outer membrane lipid asymmetry ATPase subunit MlaF